MSDQINRIKELMNLKIITEGIEPQVAKAFRDFFEHLISNRNFQRGEVDRIIGNTTRKEIKNLSTQEIEILMQKIDYESLVRVLINKNLVSSQTKNLYFTNFIDGIVQNRFTAKDAIDRITTSKYFSTLYNHSLNKPNNSAVPDFVKKMEIEFNKIFREEFETELEKRGFNVPNRNVTPQIDELSNILSDRGRIVNYIDNEVQTVLGKKIPRKDVEKFADGFRKTLEDTIQKFDPEFKVLFKDLEKHLQTLDSKQKKELLTKTFDEFVTNLSKSSKIKDTLKKKVVDYFKSGLGVKQMVQRVMNGEKIWNVYKENMTIALGTTALGTFAEILRGENPIKEWGGLTEWGRKKYFLTIIPGINTLFGVSYAILQTILLGGKWVYDKINPKEEPSGPFNKKVTRADAKDFVENKNGLSKFLPPGTSMVNLDITYKPSGDNMDVLIDGSKITTLTKGWGIGGLEVKVK